MQYYFLDWISMALSLLAVYLLGQKNRIGFISFMISNVGWIIIGIWADSYGIIVGNIVFLGLNLRGYFKWQAEDGAGAVS